MFYLVSLKSSPRLPRAAAGSGSRLPCRAPGPGKVRPSSSAPKHLPAAQPVELKSLLQMSRHNSWFVRLHRTRIAFGQSGAEIPVPGSRDLPGGIRLEPGKEGTHGHRAGCPPPPAPRSPFPGPTEPLLRPQQVSSAAAALRIPVSI